MKLRKLAAVFPGVTTTPANLDPAVGEPYRLIQCHDLTGDRVVARRRLKEVYLDPEKLPRRLPVRVGDVLVALAGVKTSVVELKMGLDWCVPEVNVAVIRATSVERRARILKYLCAPEGKERLKTLQRGRLVKRLLVRDLRELDIPGTDELVDATNPEASTD